jgi:hypothetical protein
VLLHDGWLEAAPALARGRRLAAKFHGVSNLSLFLRFFNAMAFSADFKELVIKILFVP